MPLSSAGVGIIMVSLVLVIPVLWVVAQVRGRRWLSYLLLTSEQDELQLPLTQEIIIPALCWTMPLSSAGEIMIMVSLVLVSGEMGDNLNAIDL